MKSFVVSNNYKSILLGVARWPPPASGEATATPKGGWRWPDEGSATPIDRGWQDHPFSFFFFEFFEFFFFFFFFLKKKLIYLFFNKFIFFYSDGHVSPSYWFDMALTWHLIESVKFFNRI
jgi:hypothetical protein